MIEPLTSLIRGKIIGDVGISAGFLKDVQKAGVKHIINQTPALALAVRDASLTILRTTCHPLKNEAAELLMESTLEKEKTCLSLTPHGLIVTDANVSLMAPHLAKYTQLRALSLRGSQLLSRGARHLSVLTQLVSLDLAKCSQIGNDEIRELKRLTNLQELILERTPKVHLDALQFPNLTSLSYFICRDALTDEGLRLVCRISTLKRLILGNCERVTNNGLKHITALKSLETLSMNSLVSVEDKGLEAVFSLPRIKHLTLRRCHRASDNCFKALPHKTLRTLELTVFSRLTTRGVRKISQAKELRRLNLNFCSRIQTPELISLSSLTKLESLSLKNHLNARSEVFRAWLPMKNLLMLNLAMCDNVDDACLESIGTMHRLQHLDLTRCFQITDRGLSYLDKLPDLVHVDISFCYKVNQDNLSQKILKVLKIVHP